MTNPLHASHYADRAIQQTVDVVENVRLATRTYRLRFRCPEMARRILPGQFLMLRLANIEDPLLGRPLALYDTVGGDSNNTESIDVVYLVGGKLTRRLEELSPGQHLEVWGPLGNGFPLQPARHLIMVAGGIGQTPFVALAKQYLGRQSYGEAGVSGKWAERVSLCYGARSADLLAGLDDFRAAGVELHLATDDGSRGHHGLVTEVLESLLDQAESDVHVVSCGPEPMMEAVADITSRRRVPCQVSLETPMACGIGICFSCVAKIEVEPGQWDYQRTCVEGPVFDASRVVW